MLQLSVILSPGTQAQEELHNVATVESEFIEQDFETENVGGSENEQINLDAPRLEDAHKLQSNLLNPDHVNHELEAGSDFVNLFQTSVRTRRPVTLNSTVRTLLNLWSVMRRRKKFEPDVVEQATASGWNWVFGEVLSDTSNKQTETPGVCLLHKEKAKTKETADEISSSTVTRKAKTQRGETIKDGCENSISNPKRIVVERTIREVCERAFAEARESAAIKRANAEAKQKATADDQERSQKKSSEVKLAAEKNSLEDKLKNTVKPDTGCEGYTWQEETKIRYLTTFIAAAMCSTDGKGNVQKGSSYKDRLDDDKPSESALRFQARNKRRQRIAERAPMHPTEIVTADVVKKAYRKATLFVHPDNLQQWGATVKQKYIYEKVYDLLKVSFAHLHL
uniref:J domain-containing protein n=1 Tax=Kalanchoe fedtschenkoi TaxID=63787 RepID=A0A7N0T5Y8_KALFE